MTARALSPCIGTCRIDDARGLCTGCLRSLAEIAAWSAMTDDERRAVMAGLPDRAPQARGS